MIAQTDIDHLKIIRDSVDEHIRSALNHYWYGDRILDIAPQDHAGAKAVFVDVKTFDIREGSDYTGDICQNNSHIIPDGSFDIIFCTEVLEHVANPFAAVTELHRMLRTGGRLFVTTPFNFRIHGPLPDNWRFTIHGLTELFKNWDATITQVDSDRYLMPIHYRVIAKKL